MAKGWKGEPQRHSLAARGIKTGTKIYKNPVQKTKQKIYYSPADAWDQLVGQQGPDEFMEYSKGMTVEDSVDDYLENCPFDPWELDEIDYSSARKQLIEYIKSTTNYQ